MKIGEVEEMEEGKEGVEEGGEGRPQTGRVVVWRAARSLTAAGGRRRNAGVGESVSNCGAGDRDKGKVRGRTWERV
jgi:hypothetical protein